MRELCIAALMHHMGPPILTFAGSALDWVHQKNLCHLDVKLDNILVFKSDFSCVKLCDFGSVRTQGDIVIKKNELLPYCPPELFARHANEYYQVDKAQDVFQVLNSDFDFQKQSDQSFCGMNHLRFLANIFTF